MLTSSDLPLGELVHIIDRRKRVTLPLACGYLSFFTVRHKMRHSHVCVLHAVTVDEGRPDWRMERPIEKRSCQEPAITEIFSPQPSFMQHLKRESNSLLECFSVQRCNSLKLQCSTTLCPIFLIKITLASLTREIKNCFHTVDEGSEYLHQ